MPTQAWACGTMAAMGYGFEDFHTGDVIDLGSTVVDREEMLAFARRFDPQPFHVDEDAARGFALGRPVRLRLVHLRAVDAGLRGHRARRFHLTGVPGR